MNAPLSYIEISKSDLIHNFNQFRKFLKPGAKIATVVKANAYGHGQNEIVNILKNYADYFQVDDLLELKKLRKITKKPALVFGYIAKNELEQAVKLRGTLGIYDLERAKALEILGNQLHKKIGVHIKIDTYLGRQGVTMSKIPSFLAKLRKLKNLRIEGIYSHFANLEDTSSFAHAQKQIDALNQAFKLFENNGYKNLLKHISATSGILAYEQNSGKNQLVRLGIGLYGMWPSEALKKQYHRKIDLKPIIRWVTHIAQVKELPAKHPIGYGLTFVTPRKMKVAVIPQGYSDGYDRGLSNQGEVLIQGRKCKVLGRVAMNMFVADVSHLRAVRAEDQVVLLGAQNNNQISAEEMADKLDTINYEITARVSPLLPRVIV